MTAAAPLPSLSAVRVFEAVARRLSFTRAAEELGMTQAAVSYQIKGLEDRLGQPVFERRGREIALTRAGERLAGASTEAMTLLRNAFADLQTKAEGVLAVTALTTFSATWLVPRLGRFQLENPQIAVRLDTSARLVDLLHEDFDIAIRAGKGEWPGLAAHKLLPSVYTPLCTPELWERLGRPERPQDLRGAPLIGMREDWENWFAAAGSELPAAEIGPRVGYDSQHFDVTAAVAGQGVALASPIFFAPEVAAGRLVRPFATVCTEGHSYWLVYPHARRTSPKIRLFRDWLLGELAADEAAQAEAAASAC
ncbi:MAG TPA: transcriptional regulator GcvA [Caulobacteraceae bacterium]|jgi:LysR family glycine cleavage system transcriptional activator